MGEPVRVPLSLKHRKQGPHSQMNGPLLACGDQSAGNPKKIQGSPPLGRRGGGQLINNCPHHSNAGLQWPALP